MRRHATWLGLLVGPCDMFNRYCGGRQCTSEWVVATPCSSAAGSGRRGHIAAHHTIRREQLHDYFGVGLAELSRQNLVGGVL